MAARKKKAAKKKAAPKKRAAKKPARKPKPPKKPKAAKGKPATMRVKMLETSSGPQVLRIMGRTYEVPTDQAEAMLAAGQCEPATE